MRIDAQHFHFAPLALRAAGTELAFDEAAALDEALQRRRHDRDAEAVAPRDVGRRERAVRAREAEHEIAGGIGDRLEIAIGEAVRKRDAEGVAVAAGVLDGDEALLARDRDFDDAARLRPARAWRPSRRRAIARRFRRATDRRGGAADREGHRSTSLCGDRRDAAARARAATSASASSSSRSSGSPRSSRSCA